MEASTHNVVSASPTHSKPGCAIFVACFSGYAAVRWLENHYPAAVFQRQVLRASRGGRGGWKKPAESHHTPWGQETHPTRNCTLILKRIVPLNASFPLQHSVFSAACYNTSRLREEKRAAIYTAEGSKYKRKS